MSNIKLWMDSMWIFPYKGDCQVFFWSLKWVVLLCLASFGFLVVFQVNGLVSPFPIPKTWSECLCIVGLVFYDANVCLRPPSHLSWMTRELGRWDSQLLSHLHTHIDTDIKINPQLDTHFTLKSSMFVFANQINPIFCKSHCGFPSVLSPRVQLLISDTAQHTSGTEKAGFQLYSGPLWIEKGSCIDSESSELKMYMSTQL